MRLRVDAGVACRRVQESRFLTEGREVGSVTDQIVRRGRDPERAERLCVRHEKRYEQSEARETRGQKRQPDAASTWSSSKADEQDERHYRGDKGGVIDRRQADGNTGRTCECRTRPRRLAQVPQQRPEEERYSPGRGDRQVPEMQEAKRREGEEGRADHARPRRVCQLHTQQVRAHTAEDDAAEERDVERQNRRSGPGRGQRDERMSEQQVVEGRGAIVGKEDVGVDPRPWVGEERVVKPVELPGGEQNFTVAQRGAAHLAGEWPGHEHGCHRGQGGSREEGREPVREHLAQACSTRHGPRNLQQCSAHGGQ